MANKNQTRVPVKYVLLEQSLQQHVQKGKTEYLERVIQD